MRNRLLCLLLVAVFIPCATHADTVVEEIIARVNNAIITRSEYDHSRNELKQELDQQDPATADKLFAERQKDILRDLIDQQLLLQRGADLGITGETEVIKQLDEMRKQMHLDSMEALQKAAEAQGVSFEDYKEKLKEQIITQRVIGSEVGSKVQVTPEDEHKFYDDHKADLDQPEQIRLSELLISTEKATDDQQIASAKTEADSLLEQIHKGASFDDLAKKYSNDPSAKQGGDLGYFKRGVLAKQLEDMTFAMKAGEVSNVIRTKQGFIILKVTEHQAGGIPAFKEVESKVQEAVYMDKLQPALRAYLEKLRVEAYIDVKPGYVDSAASADETKPIETDVKEASAKQLKKKKKLGVF